jgi:hypothetical protein
MPPAGYAYRAIAFGGPAAESNDARMVLTQGMDPAVVARAALDGVETETFLIATHSHVRAYWQRRCQDIEQAFDVLAHSDIPDESYDVMEVAARLRSEMTPET